MIRLKHNNVDFEVTITQNYSKTHFRNIFRSIFELQHKLKERHRINLAMQKLKKLLAIPGLPSHCFVGEVRLSMAVFPLPKCCICTCNKK